MRLAVSCILMSLFAAVSGCDTIGGVSGAPSRTSLPDNYPPGTPKGEKVAVCYGRATPSMDALAAAAAGMCRQPGSTVEFITEDLYLNECPLLKKRRAVFACRAPG